MLYISQVYFSRFLTDQTMKTKYDKYTLQAFRNFFSRKNTPEKFWVDKGTENVGSVKNFARRRTLKITQQRVRQKLHLQRKQFSL